MNYCSVFTKPVDSSIEKPIVHYCWFAYKSIVSNPADCSTTPCIILVKLGFQYLSIIASPLDSSSWICISDMIISKYTIQNSAVCSIPDYCSTFSYFCTHRTESDSMYDSPIFLDNFFFLIERVIFNTSNFIVWEITVFNYTICSVPVNCSSTNIFWEVFCNRISIDEIYVFNNNIVCTYVKNSWGIISTNCMTIAIYYNGFIN